MFIKWYLKECSKTDQSITHYSPPPPLEAERQMSWLWIGAEDVVSTWKAQVPPPILFLSSLYICLSPSLACVADRDLTLLCTCPPSLSIICLFSLPLFCALALRYSPDGQQLEPLRLWLQTRGRYFFTWCYVCFYLVCQEAREATCSE